MQGKAENPGNPQPSVQEPTTIKSLCDQQPATTHQPYFETCCLAALYTNYPTLKLTASLPCCLAVTC